VTQMKERVLVGQFSGAVGTLAALGADGLAVQQRLFEDLGLHCPNIAWHVARDRISELVTTLAIATSTIGKIAHEIYCLQKTETAELEEPFETGKVGSSTMPHKRNPPNCETIVAIARIVRGTVPLALEASITEHERDKIGLQTEREFISKVCCMTGAAVAKLCPVIEGLSVRQENMERNLYLQKGMLLSEAVMMKLGLVIGRQEAHEIVYRICMDAFGTGCSLKEGLMADPQVATRISVEEIDAMLDPHAYVGLAPDFVDRVAGLDHRAAHE
jgi:3-carboxy-cis,cis-muconate cycloisomerase